MTDKNKSTTDFNKKHNRVGRPRLAPDERIKRDIKRMDQKIIDITDRLKTNPHRPKGRGRPPLSSKELMRLVEKRNEYI